MPYPPATHEVFNQSTELADLDLFAGHRPLRDALSALAPDVDTAPLHALGRELGSAEVQHQARLANRHPPRHRPFDRNGRRVDEVEFHPAYHALMARAAAHGLQAAPWARPPGAHVARAAGFLLFNGVEAGVMCPTSMSYAATPALRANAALYADWGPGLSAPAYDPRALPGPQKAGLTMGMGMTEKQGGSDLRANTSRAAFDQDTPLGRSYRLTGHKWFFSAPMSDAHLMLALTAAGPTCFFVPRLLPDGSRNGLQIQRLKDKLGNHANASAEVEFDGAIGWLVGEEGRGIAQILEMGTLTRLDCALGTAGLMRHALALALHHCAQRSAFGKKLMDQPLMRQVLADLALEVEGATALVMCLAAAVDASSHGRGGEHEAQLRRLLTPIAKFWVCKRGSHFGQEAMECLGGNGYVEDDGHGPMARLYREMPLNSIWEGAGNVMALDLLRALRSVGVAEALARELVPLRGAHRGAEALAATLPDRLQRCDESQARRLARDVALLMQAALLLRLAPQGVFAAFCAARIDAGSDVFGQLPAACDVGLLLERAMG